MSVGSNDILRRAKSVIWRRTGDEIVILSEDGTQLTNLNPTAALIWSSLDGTRTVSEIAHAVVREFKVEDERALPDVVRFCEALLAEDLAVAASDVEPDEDEESIRESASGSSN